MASRLTTSLHHLIGTSGLKSMAVTEGICQSMLDSCYDANSIRERLRGSVRDCVLNCNHND